MFKKLFIALSLILTFATPAHAIDGFITITNPNGGTFTEGDTMNITWTSSPNIDMVNIGYKSCPSCLDWVVFTTPNTGSYNWNINVGNTTNTQFYLQITGYETGQGSVTSNSGTFTVNQNPPINTGSTTATATPTPTSAPSTTTSPSYPTGYRPLPTATPTPTPTPKPLTPTLSVYNLIIYQEFYFEGSLTTNLKDIQDPKNVENFTLDTQQGFTFIFEESLNLTDQKTLAAIQNTEEYWEYETWFIWIEWEWWIKYDITETINVEYKNEALTAYAPELVTEPKPTPTPAKAVASPKPRQAPTILGAQAGKVMLALNDGTPVKIKPKVQLDAHDSPVATPTITLTGHTSHTNLTWTLNHNGNKSEVTPSINKDNGQFELKVQDLVEGANTFVLSYKEPDSDPVPLEPLTVVYKPNFFSLYGVYLLAILAALTVVALALLARRNIKKIKKFLKIKKH